MSTSFYLRDMFLHCRQSELDAIATTLKSNKSLKILNVSGGSVFSKTLASGVDFKLRELSIGQIEYETPFQQNFNSFLKTQRDSLEALTIEQELEAEVFRTILSMTRLKDIWMRSNDIDLLKYSADNFPQNFSLETFFFKGPINNRDLFKKVLSMFPKVAYLNISNLTNEVAEIISETCKHLKKISTAKFSATNVSNEVFYKNLEKLYSFQVNGDSQKLFEKLNGYSG